MKTVLGVLASVLVLIMPALAADNELDLTVKIGGGTPGTGQMIVSLFDSEETYLKSPADQQFVPVDNAGRSEAIFSGLAAGDYAVSVIYDENGDGKLNVNLFRLPTEKTGFSNNAKPRMGPPAFEKARFDLSAGNTTIDIVLGTAATNER